MAEHEDTDSKAEPKHTYETASPYYKSLHREPRVIEGQAVEEPAIPGLEDPAHPSGADPAAMAPHSEPSESEQFAKEELAKDQEYAEASPESPPHASVSPPPLPRNSGLSLAALLAAAIIGALAGFAGAYAARLFLDDPQKDVASLDERFSALNTKLAADEKKIEALSSGSRDALGALEKRLGSVEKSAKDALGLATAAQQTASAGNSGTETPALPVTVVTPPPAPDLTPLQARLDALEQRLGKLDTFEQRLGKLETAVNAPKIAERAPQEPESKPNPLEANAPAIAIVAENLAQKIASGAPYTAEIAALEKLGVDKTKLAALQPSAAKGVVTNKSLNDDFSKLVPALLATGKPASPPQENIFARLIDHASGLVRVHKIGDVSGDDLSARIARAQAALARDDTDAALQEWAAFPEPAKTASAAWADRAKARVANVAAAKTVISEAMANLTKVKS